MAGFLGLVALSAVVLVPVASGRTPTCRIHDRSARRSYTDLQSAVNAAHRGATLLVTGTCTGTTTIAKHLTLKGERRGATSAPTLDGAGASGSVLTIDAGVHVSVDSLTITGGNTSGQGGGISVNPGATVVLNHSTISGNAAGFGGGIASDYGRVILNHSRITANSATVDGGGADIYPGGALIVRRASRIDDNRADLNGGGIANFDSGTVMLKGGSTISGNAVAGSGGGVYNSCDGVAACTGAIALRDGSSIHDNAAGANGGGISNGGGTHNQPGLAVRLSHTSSVYGNAAGGDGGGIFNFSGALRGAVAEANVFDNAPDDIS
jgi:hypothetical protein